MKSLPKNKNIDLSKLKAFADNKSNATKMMISLIDTVENIVFSKAFLENTVGKGENAVTSILSFSHNVFQSRLLLGC